MFHRIKDADTHSLMTHKPKYKVHVRWYNDYFRDKNAPYYDRIFANEPFVSTVVNIKYGCNSKYILSLNEGYGKDYANIIRDLFKTNREVHITYIVKGSSPEIIYTEKTENYRKLSCFSLH